MTTDVPTDAVEGALSLVAEREYANALRANPTFAPAAAWADLTETQRRVWADEYRDTVTAALTAAAPHIVKQSTADLRAGIEALRDEWRAEAATRTSYIDMPGTNIHVHRALSMAWTQAADALDALIGGA